MRYDIIRNNVRVLPKYGNYEVCKISIPNSINGGWIGNSFNLDDNPSSSAFVFDDAMVFENAVVSDSAAIRNRAIVHMNAHCSEYATVQENAIISDYANINGHSVVEGCARCAGNSVISENAHVRGHATITGNAFIGGNAIVEGNAHVSCDAIVKGNAHIHGNAYIHGFVEIYDNANIGTDASIESVNDYLVIGPLTDEREYITFYRTYNDRIHVSCYFYTGDIEFFIPNAITHGIKQESEFMKKLMLAVELAKLHICVKSYASEVSPDDEAVKAVTDVKKTKTTRKSTRKTTKRKSMVSSNPIEEVKTEVKDEVNGDTTTDIEPDEGEE